MVSESAQKYKRFLHLMFAAGLLVVFLSHGVFAQGAKKIIATVADLPEFGHAVPENLGDLLESDAVYQPFAAQVRADTEAVLRDYDVRDKTLLRQLKANLAYLDFAENKFDAARERIKQVRELETPDEKLRNGDLLVIEAILNAFDASGEKSGAKFHESFRRIFNETVNALPDNLRAGMIGEKDFFRDVNEEYLINDLTANLAPIAKKNNGKIPLKNVSSILGARIERRFFIELKDDIRTAYAAYLNSHKPVNIWANREVVLTNKQKLKPVVVGIWDSGVDASLFPNQMFINKREKLNGRDDDGNGFVDDIHGIAFDEQANYSTDELFPLAKGDESNYLEWTRSQNLDADLRDGIETADTAAFKQKMAERQKDEAGFKKYLDRSHFFGSHAHGTEVASIVVKGNPAVRFLSARIAFSNASGVHPAPNEELSRRIAENFKKAVAYFKANCVRVVNMSWQENPKEIADDLKTYNIGASDDERKQIARKLFTIERDALFAEIKNAPEILFVCIAGNDALDASDNEYIPASFDLPNLLTIGAVDISGAKASFTNTGKSVTLYGYGVNVPVFVPKGIAVRNSGTSLASPQVAGLAAKLLALDPKLTVAEIVALIRGGAEKSATDEKMMIINPKKSVELLMERRKK